MSETLWARKGKHKKKFQRVAWDLLSNKNGWEEEPSEPSVKDEVVRRIPDAGQKKTRQIVENKAAPKEKQVVENKADKKDMDTTEEPSEPSVKDEVVNGSNVAFIEFVKDDLSKTQIKDYLDLKNVPYKNNMGLEALGAILFDYFNGSLDALKEAFNLTNASNNEL